MAEAIAEMSHYAESDYLLVNDVFEVALDDLCTIISSHHLHTDKQVKTHAGLLQDLLS